MLAGFILNPAVPGTVSLDFPLHVQDLVLVPGTGTNKMYRVVAMHPGAVQVPVDFLSGVKQYLYVCTP